jgi:uncharacterized protein
MQEKLKEAMAAQDEITKSALRFILGEFSRGKDKEIADEKAVKIIRKAIEDEISVSGSWDFMAVLKQFIPAMATSAEIRDWVNENIDFTQFKNKMQAMKPIMAHFAGRVDGNVVKSILEEM